jgi:hypothetical protein
MRFCRRKAVVAFLLGFTASLQGCGGGSNSDASVSVTTFPVASVVAALATKGGQFIAFPGGLAGRSQPYVVEYIPVMSGRYTRQAPVIGSNLQVASATVDFLTSPFTVTGWTDEKLNPAAQLQVTPLPVTAKIGDGSRLMWGQQLIQDNGLSTGDIGLTHGVWLDWTLTAHSSSTADLCLSQAIIADFFRTTTIDCFEIDAAGKILGFKTIVRNHAKGFDEDIVFQ